MEKVKNFKHFHASVKAFLIAQSSTNHTGDAAVLVWLLLLLHPAGDFSAGIRGHLIFSPGIISNNCYGQLGSVPAILLAHVTLFCAGGSGPEMILRLSMCHDWTHLPLGWIHPSSIPSPTCSTPYSPSPALFWLAALGLCAPKSPQYPPAFTGRYAAYGQG